MSKNISQSVYSIIARECGIRRKNINTRTAFISNPSISYFECMGALYTLQHKFGVNLPESDFDKYATVGELTKSIIFQLKKHSK